MGRAGSNCFIGRSAALGYLHGIRLSGDNSYRRVRCCCLLRVAPASTPSHASAIFPQTGREGISLARLEPPSGNGSI